MVLKLALMPWYLQAYLDMAYHRTEAQKKEAGRVTNIEYQKKVRTPLPTTVNTNLVLPTTALFKRNHSYKEWRYANFFYEWIISRLQQCFIISAW